MTFIVIPHEITTTTATLWIGALCEDNVPNSPLELDLNGESQPVEGKWRMWQTFKETDRDGFPPADRRLHDAIPQAESIKERIHYQRIELNDLNEDTQYHAKLVVNNEETDGIKERLSSCSFRTLPCKLPEAKSGSTFNILLGSCFYRRCDSHGMVGRTFAALPECHRPHLKFLCGDQVYLDNPWLGTTLNWNLSYRQPGIFRKMFLDKYLETWTQSPDETSGFNRLLKEGANYFCSDDHEFWNNAPRFGGVGLANTLLHSQRSWWFEEARKLFRVFQARASIQGFEVGKLAVKVVDTRIDRDTSSIRFMLYENLEEVKDWLSSLDGPGLLVLGQPVLEADAPEKWKNRILSHFDRNLADFGQYVELKQSIVDCPHSIVVLTGDVHFARVSYLPPEIDGITKFVEVVSSPMCLVPGPFGRSTRNGWQAASPIDARPVESEKPFGEQHCDHFATIQFSSIGDDKVKMNIFYWPILSSAILSSDQDAEPVPVGPYEFTLK